jgi:hypothetical protein
LLPGSAILLFFSVRTYAYNGKYGTFDGLEKALGLNVLSMVLVNDEHDLGNTGGYAKIGYDRAVGIDRVRKIEELEFVMDVIV